MNNITLLNIAILLSFFSSILSQEIDSQKHKILLAKIENQTGRNIKVFEDNKEIAPNDFPRELLFSPLNQSKNSIIFYLTDPNDQTFSSSLNFSVADNSITTQITYRTVYKGQTEHELIDFISLRMPNPDELLSFSIYLQNQDLVNSKIIAVIKK